MFGQPKHRASWWRSIDSDDVFLTLPSVGCKVKKLCHLRSKQVERWRLWWPSSVWSTTPSRSWWRWATWRCRWAPSARYPLRKPSASKDFWHCFGGCGHLGRSLSGLPSPWVLTRQPTSLLTLQCHCVRSPWQRSFGPSWWGKKPGLLVLGKQVVGSSTCSITCNPSTFLYVSIHQIMVMINSFIFR